MSFGLTTFGDVLVFAAGFAVCWFFKDPVTKMITGTENFVKSLEAKIAALKK
jgi:hypothetical protein